MFFALFRQATALKQKSEGRAFTANDSNRCKPVVYEHLKSQRADILVTHEAGSAHPHGFAAIDELARAMGVARTFHGHHHNQFDYSADRARLGFSAFGVGFRGIVDIDGRSSNQ